MNHGDTTYYIPIDRYYAVHSYCRARVNGNPYTEPHPLPKDELERRRKFLDWLETLFKSDIIPDELLQLHQTDASGSVQESARKVYEEVYRNIYNTNGILPTSVQRIHSRHDVYDGPYNMNATHMERLCPYVESFGERNVYGKWRDHYLTKVHEARLTEDFKDVRLGYTNENEVETRI